MMKAGELDALIAERLPGWFEPGERFSAPEVYALLTSKEHLDIDPDEVYDALERLADSGSAPLKRLRARHTPRWDRLYQLTTDH